MTLIERPDARRDRLSPAVPLDRKLARLWRRHGWLVIGLLWVIALILGCIGFALNARSAGNSASFADVAYRTL